MLSMFHQLAWILKGRFNKIYAGAVHWKLQDIVDKNQTNAETDPYLSSGVSVLWWFFSLYLLTEKFNKLKPKF